MTVARAPLILPFAGVDPVIGRGCRACAGSSVLGRVTAGTSLLLGPFATIRADGDTVTVGDGVCLGEGATIHIAHDRYPTIVGHRVTVGRNAVVHASTVGDDCVIEDDVVILDASEVGPGALVEAGSTVYPRSRLEAHGRYAGSPAVLIGTISPDALGMRAAAIREAVGRVMAQPLDPGGRRAVLPDANFVAETALLSGRVTLGHDTSVFFGCRLRTGALAVGETANIQDNCVIETSGDVVIGRASTLGHNVLMAEGRIGDRSLVGIGAVLAPGTIVEDDVLVAAGTATTDGQTLELGWLWGSRPAKPLKRLDDARRAMMAETVRHYVDYGRAFREAQIRAADGHGRPSATSSMETPWSS